MFTGAKKKVSEYFCKKKNKNNKQQDEKKNVCVLVRWDLIENNLNSSLNQNHDYIGWQQQYMRYITNNCAVFFPVVVFTTNFLNHKVESEKNEKNVSPNMCVCVFGPINHRELSMWHWLLCMYVLDLSFLVIARKKN